MMTNIKVNDRCILDNYPTISSGGVNDFELNFQFENPADWDGLIKIAIFTAGEQSVRVGLIDDKCYIPADVLKNEGDITIGVYGYELVSNDTVALRRSPVPFVVTVEEGSYRESASEPTPQQVDICEQALAVAESVRRDADNGVFDGEQGPQGEQGPKGDTGATGPQGPKGEKGDAGDDYVLTAQDKIDIANIVITLIPDGNEVSY